MDTVNDAIEWFLAHCADHRKPSPHTLKAYKRDLSHFCLFAVGHAVESAISTADRNLVQHWLKNMNSVKPRTIRRRLATLKSMLAALERHGRLEINPLSAAARCALYPYALGRVFKT